MRHEIENHSLSNPEQWVVRYGDYLFRYARFRVWDHRAAEDLVQETLLAALQAQAHFAGQSSERTWLVAILKHKILDHFRKAGRERLVYQDEGLNGTPEDLFDDAGHWKSGMDGPKEWGANPSLILERKEFWDVLQRCLSELPSRMASAFSLREIDDLPSEEICKVLNISATNLGVMLHRARGRLRRCLEIRFIGLRTS